MAGLQHALALNKNLDQRARERFTSSMRAWVLTDLAGQMQTDYAIASELAGISHDHIANRVTPHPGRHLA